MRGAVAGLVSLALLAGCGGGTPRALIVAQVTKAPSVPSFRLVRVTVAGISGTSEGDGDVSIGIYVPGDLKEPPLVRAEGVAEDGTVVAEAMTEAGILPGQVSVVRLTLMIRSAADGGAPARQADAGSPEVLTGATDGPPVDRPGDGGALTVPDGPPDLAVSSPEVGPDAPVDRPGDLSPDVPPGTPPAFGCPSDNALVACYTFDEDTGGNISDGSGRGNAGTTDATRVRGVHGMALRFADGMQVAQVRNAPSLKLMGSNATIEAWVKPAMYPNEMALDFLVGKVGSNPQDGYAFGMASGKFGGYAGGSGQLAGNVPTGVWSHLAVVWGPDGMSHYYNGTRIGSFGRLDLTVNDEPLTLGNRSRVGAPISAPYFAFYGELDVVRIYARARTAEEICADANRTMVGASCI